MVASDIAINQMGRFFLDKIAILVVCLLLYPSHSSALDLTSLQTVDAAIALLLPDANRDIQQFYSVRQMRPAWQQQETVSAFAMAIASLHDDGLFPDDYCLQTLLEHDHQRPKETNVMAKARFDLTVSHRLFLVLHHLQQGKVNPLQVDPHWEIARPAFRLDFASISQAVDERQLNALFMSARPRHPLYHQMQSGLAYYRNLAVQGGWPILPEFGVSLQPGTQHDSVPLLRKRLAITDASLQQTDDRDKTLFHDPRYYDEALVDAVRRFQRQHGLNTDGIVGRQTLAALNVPVNARIDQIRANLERARWLLPDLPSSFILVNIPSAELIYFRPDGKTWRTRVVVGRPDRQTPILRSQITHLTFNPSWTVPPTILREDMLPKIQRDLAYLDKQNILVLSDAGEPLDPAVLDWSSPGNIMLRQSAGPLNPLGRVVFRFPNKHQVYLHDTPSRWLFAQDRRMSSSGCVRVSRALELAEHLLANENEMASAKISEVLGAGKTRQIYLAQPMPIMLYYWTVYTNEWGDLAFYPDIYNRDPPLLAALHQSLGHCK